MHIAAARSDNWGRVEWLDGAGDLREGHCGVNGWGLSRLLWLEGGGLTNSDAEDGSKGELPSIRPKD